MDAPDAIAVLAAGVRPQADGTWSSTDLTAEDDTYGAPGGKLRVLAGAMLAARHAHAIVISGGALGFESPVARARPTLAEILGAELAAAGVPRDRLVLEDRSNSTFQELAVLREIVAERRLRHVVIVTSRWHAARVRAMLDARFRDLAAGAVVCAAEDILIDADPETWRPAIERAYQSPFIAARLEREREGIGAILSGAYEFRP